MPVLRNAKHELFAQELAKGKGITEAYVAAGYSDAPAAATRLAKKVNFRAEEIKSMSTRKVVDKLAVTEGRVLAELAKLGFSNMLDYVRINEQGDPQIDLSRLDRETAAAIGEITINTRTEKGGENRPDAEVKSVKFKLSDKRAALVDLGKHLGMFKERVELTGKDGGAIEVVDLTPTERARRIAFALARAQRSKSPDKPQE